MKLYAAVFSALMLAVLLVAGCEFFAPDETESGQVMEISEFGGFTATDEAPAFGDADLLRGYQEDEPFDDDMERNPEVRDAEANRRSRQYALRIIWGNAHRRDSTLADTDGCPVTDWSGMIEVDGGVVTIRRLILFEPSDSIVRPRRGPRKVQWVSYTKDHVDGLLLKIIDLPDPRPRETANTLTITTPFYVGEIALTDLEDYREFVIYDDCNAISIVATRVEPFGCPKGFMEGSWVAETDTSGYFKGAWISDQGTLTGHLRGVYSIRGGNPVLFGKWISTSGDFQGLLRGTWTPVDAENGPDGLFEGRWVDEALTVQGSFRGHYALCPDNGAGTFHGRWIKDCR